MYILGTKSALIIGTEGDDNIDSTLDNATIDALGGNDTVNNRGSEVEIDGGAGDDFIDNNGEIMPQEICDLIWKEFDL